MPNNLQMIVHLPLFKIQFPGNVEYLLSILIGIATFDMIPKMDFLFGEELEADEKYQLGSKY